ncbi:hypothetical protein [Tenacibaculum piscium]|uniref:hypothetical protein n=1 Tax=Tenacibaculum piscium TaxID=1458515 RepID=UPI001F1617B7|nr:hypothetical protein [Tenacibaculum piscium]
MNKKIKWILISIVLVILIVIIAGIYKFNYLANQPGYDVDGNKIEKTHKSEILLKWFNLNTSNSFYIQIPDTNIKCEINEFDSLRFAKGNYTQGDEKGTVFIDNIEIITLNKSPENISYIMIPFSISNQGSGYFKYLGMFKIDYNSKDISQIDEYFLGDRVIINSIKYDGNDELKVILKVHSKNQPMSEAPSMLQELNLKVSQWKFKQI